ncbi:hypothetical protein ABIA00_008208 [Bradyrhizobium ottawaense]
MSTECSPRTLLVSVMASLTLYSIVPVPKSCRAVWKSRLRKPYQLPRGMPRRGHRHIALPVIGHAEIRQTAEVGVDVVRGDLDVARRGVLGRDEGAPAIVGHIIAAGDVGVLEQAARAHREGGIDDLVDVERDALCVVGPELGIHALEIAIARLLGDDVDGAAGGAAAGIGGRGTAQNLDLLGEEVLADGHGGIADAVDEHVVARIEAADEETVAERVAALARAQRHARGRAPDLLQRRRVLVLEHFLAEHRDRLGRVQHLLGKLAAGLDVVDLVGRGRICIGIAVGSA